MAHKARQAAAQEHTSRRGHDDTRGHSGTHAGAHRDERHGDSTRLDKWLWAARFFKTRSLATDAVTRGRVLVNDQPAKPSRDVRIGDLVAVRQGDIPLPRVVQVLGLSEVRGPAPVAQALYVQTPDSLAACAAWAEQRRLAPEPAHAITAGRPTKQARRDLADWQRWSASLDDD